MECYELRLFGNDQPPVAVAMTLCSDFAAIRRAKALRRGGQGVEVWRGMACIFASPPMANAASQPEDGA